MAEGEGGEREGGGVIRRLSAAAALLCVAVPTLAIGQAASASAPDPSRLAAARDLIDVLMPPATREQMVQGMMTPMLANLQKGMTENHEFVTAMQADPRVKALFDTFMDRQQTRTVAMMRDALPGMSDAMARAYARRFDLAQMRELKAFFLTPTGRTYMQQSYTIMSDPDVAAWQRSMMANSMGHVQADVADFVKQLAALEPKKKP